MELNYHVIIADMENSVWKYSPAIPFSTIIKTWKYAMSTAKGNKNRLQFYGSISKITYLPPDMHLLFYDSLINELKNLLQ